MVREQVSKSSQVSLHVGIHEFLQVCCVKMGIRGVAVTGSASDSFWWKWSYKRRNGTIHSPRLDLQRLCREPPNSPNPG
ncbi:hypothetical protein MUG91_G119n18 [Manis pentadactyla]|nr:hypothetical protein MUG91_G119n18 [Manis pentadactyla]